MTENPVKFKDMALGDMSQFDPEKFLTDLTDEDRAAFYAALEKRVARYREEYLERKAAEAEGKKPPTKRTKKKKEDAPSEPFDPSKIDLAKL